MEAQSIWADADYSCDDYEFFVKAIIHWQEIEPTFASLDMQWHAQRIQELAADMLGVNRSFAQYTI